MHTLAPLSTIPHDTIESLLDASFGADRKARTAYRMREGVAAIDALSFAALGSKGELLGTIQAWPCALETADGSLHDLTLIGPVAVLPEAQGLGLGKALTQATLDAADSGPWPALFMIGDPEYYGRFFGFSADATAGWHIPGPVERRRLLARLRDGCTLPQSGNVIPHPAFASEALRA